jgi:drug/metabolite transporter (DMT)-like permease
MPNSISAAFQVVDSRRTCDKVDLINVTAWQLIVGAIPLLALSVLFEPGGIVWDPRFIGRLALMGLVGTAMPTPIWYWRLRGDEGTAVSFPEPGSGRRTRDRHPRFRRAAIAA